MPKNTSDIHVLMEQIVESDHAVPEGVDPEALIPQLEDLLGVEDQLARERSYEILEEWAVHGHFPDDTLIALGDRMASNLTKGLGEEGTDSVFLRSFSALVLCGPICADELFGAGLGGSRTAFLSSERVDAWRGAAVESLLGEKDLRAFVDGKGWAHAAAHVGDALHQFARSPHTDAAGLEQILDAISGRLRTPSDCVFVHNEGGRLMRAAYCALLRRELPTERVLSWIEGFGTTADGRTWQWNGIYNLEFCDHRAVNAKANVCDALYTLYFYLKLGLRRGQAIDEASRVYFAFYDRPVPDREVLLEALVPVLQRLNHGLPQVE